MADTNSIPSWDQMMGRVGDSPAAGPARSHAKGASSARASGSGGRVTRSRQKASNGHRTPKRRRSRAKRIGLGIVYTILGFIILGLIAFLSLYATLKVPEPENVALAQSTTVYYADGKTPMGTFSQVNRTIIDASTLPEYVPHAVVASEDQTFYTNSGVNFKGLFRAAWNNLTGGERQGGSSITQQYVERYYEGTTTSYVGKIKEVVLALKINRQQSKDQIIGNYLNTIYFGRGAYGIEAASKAYFGHDAKDLTVSEAALLAGIIPAPSAWDPAADMGMAQQRWQRVMDNMVSEGWLSAADRAQAKFPDTVSPQDADASTSMTGTNGYLLDQMRAELKATGQFTDEQVDTGGLSIISTIDQAKQQEAVAAAETMNTVEGWDPAHMHQALSAMDPTTGEIVAEYAGADYQKRQQNAVTQDIAQAGSTFKAFALLADARQGGPMAALFDGRSPAYFEGLEKPVTNAGNYSWGDISLLTATKYSVNTAFVALNQQVGPENTRQAAIDAGIPEDTAGLDGSLLNVLGVASPHNIDITRAFGTIASGGLRTTPHIVREVKNSSGATVYRAANTSERAFDAGDVSTVLPALQQVVLPGGTGEQAAAVGHFVAGKSGTSDNQMSALFAGFTPKLVTAVSMYQADDAGNPVPLTNIGGVGQFHGGDWPATVWTSFMTAATADEDQSNYPWITTSTRKPSFTPSFEPSPSPSPSPSETPSQEPSVTEEAPQPQDQGNQGLNGSENLQPTDGPEFKKLEEDGQGDDEDRPQYDFGYN